MRSKSKFKLQSEQSKILFPLLLLLLSLGFSCLRFMPPDNFSSDCISQNVRENFSSFSFPEINQISRQKFKYLGNGMQSIAFVSEDKKYVFKFFLKHKIHKKPRIRISAFWANLFRQNSSTFSNKLYVLKSYDKAFQEMKQETGLLAVHLQETVTPNLPFLKVIDYQGKEHLIDLNLSSFVIQKYGVLVDRALQKMNPQEKKQALLKLQQLVKKIAEKGFVNNGKNFNAENFAFIKNQPVMIDVGNIKFSKNLKKYPEKEISRVIGLLYKWAQKQTLIKLNP